MPGPRFEDVTVANGAEAFLAQLNANPDVDYIFANTGTDHGPILEALAKMHRSESKGAEIVVVPHEQAAVSMAHGYYCASGKPQVVLVHTLPGTANGLGGLMNAKACQVPMLFVAGRTPVTEGEVAGGKSRHIHWRQESRDQGSIVREFVKWDFENRANEQLGAIVPRAFKIAMAEPRGPVYLSLPREWLYESMETTRVSAEVFEPPSKIQTPVGDLERAAEILHGRVRPGDRYALRGQDPRRGGPSGGAGGPAGDSGGATPAVAVHELPVEPPVPCRPRHSRPGENGRRGLSRRHRRALDARHPGHSPPRGHGAATGGGPAVLVHPGVGLPGGSCHDRFVRRDAAGAQWTRSGRGWTARRRCGKAWRRGGAASRPPTTRPVPSWRRGSRRSRTSAPSTPCGCPGASPTWWTRRPSSSARR